MSSLVISMLRGQKLPLQLWTAQHVQPVGAIGLPGVLAASTSAPSLPGLPETNMLTCSWLLLPKSFVVLLVKADRLGANPLPLPCAMSSKPLFWQATAAPDTNSTVPSSA